MAVPLTQQLREVARTYVKLKELGRKPKRSFCEIARTEFGADDKTQHAAYGLAHYFKQTIGIPHPKDALASPCHTYPTEKGLREFEIWNQKRKQKERQT